jgi:hypothetical protein
MMMLEFVKRIREFESLNLKIARQENLKKIARQEIWKKITRQEILEKIA